MSYHIFQKRNSQSVFSTKRKTSNQNQNHKNRKECHEHCTIFHCIALLHTKLAFTSFQDEGCVHLHPKKSCSYLAISAQMRGLLKESTSCFLIRLKPFGTCTYWLACIGLKVLTFIFHKTQSPRFCLSQDSKSSIFIFHRTQSLLSYLLLRGY